MFEGDFVVAEVVVHRGAVKGTGDGEAEGGDLHEAEGEGDIVDGAVFDDELSAAGAVGFVAEGFLDGELGGDLGGADAFFVFVGGGGGEEQAGEGCVGPLVH